MFCGVGFEALHVAAQIGRGGDGMEMVFENDIAEELEAGFSL